MVEFHAVCYFGVVDGSLEELGETVGYYHVSWVVGSCNKVLLYDVYVHTCLLYGGASWGMAFLP